MTVQSTLFKGVVSAAILGAAALGVHYLNRSEAAPAVLPPSEHLPPGIVKFGPNAPQMTALKIDSVVAMALPVSDVLNGRVTYDESVTTRVTSPVAGRVLALRAEIGDVVKRGALLADLDSPDLATAEADWRKAQSDEVRKRLALTRAQTLFDGEVMARKDFESADADFQQAHAETRRAALRMRNLNARGSDDGKFGLVSPIAGIVADKQINPGQEVRPDVPNPLFVISDLRHLWVMIDVPERAAAEIRIGQAVSLETEAYAGQRFSARVERVALALDPVTRRIQVRCSVDNSSRKLKPEMFARVSFLTEDSSKKAIPLANTSLFAEGIYSYVFVEKQPGTFEKRRVNVKLKGRERSFIDAGLVDGERVVTEGAFLLNAEVASDAQ